MALSDARWEGKVQPWLGMDWDEFFKLPFPRTQERITPKKLREVCEQNLPGEFHKITFPHSPEQIEEWGPEWLDKALHVAKTLPEDVTVKAFTKLRVLAGDTTNLTDNPDDSNWGGAGIKVMLSVEYSKPADGVTQDFFIKIPHKMGNKSERHKISILLNNDFPEVLFNVMFVGKTPFRSPRCYFADMSRDSTNYIVIMERLPFAQKKNSYEPGELLPAPGKYLDFQLETKGADYYYALARSYARATAWYQASSVLSPQLDYLFMTKDACEYLHQERNEAYDNFGPLDQRVKWMASWVEQMGEEGFMQHVAPYGGFPEAISRGFLDFALDWLGSTQLLPKDLNNRAFREQIRREAEEFVRYGGLINWVLSKVYWELNVLSHPNLQVDNAFYWRDAEGEMQAGILDFGSMMHMSCANVLSGSWSGAEWEVMDEHEDKLCDFFVDQLVAAGGTCCSKDEFRTMIKLARGSSWTGQFVNFPKLYQLCPPKEFATIKSRSDPRFQAFLVRCYGYGPVISTMGWKNRNPTQSLQTLLHAIGLKK